MKKFIKKSVILLATICCAIFTLILTGNYLLPDKVVFYDDQSLIKLERIFYAEKNSGETVAAAAKIESKTTDITADVSIFGVIPVSQISAEEAERKYVHVGGDLIGIRLYTDGLLVVGIDEVVTQNGNVSPANICGIREGDIITHVNKNEVSSVSSFSSYIASSDGNTLDISVKRGNKEFVFQLTPVFSSNENKYRCGLWLRDSTAGIGTLTFTDPETKTIATLGHAICDSETQAILPVGDGDVLTAKVSGCIPGQKGVTGQIKGNFDSEVLGTLHDNNEFGVYGTYTNSLAEEGEIYPVASPSETETGSAQIITTVTEDGPEFYDIEIEKITYTDEMSSRSMVIKIVDEDLLEITGGIVQGMSGSPIVQNGMIVGAVTHVLLNDPTKGYGIFAETMLSAAERSAE